MGWGPRQSLLSWTLHLGMLYSHSLILWGFILNVDWRNRTAPKVPRDPPCLTSCKRKTDTSLATNMSDSCSNYYDCRYMFFTVEWWGGGMCTLLCVRVHVFVCVYIWVAGFVCHIFPYGPMHICTHVYLLAYRCMACVLVHMCSYVMIHMSLLYIYEGLFACASSVWRITYVCVFPSMLWCVCVCVCNVCPDGVSVAHRPRCLGSFLEVITGFILIDIAGTPWG